MKGVGPVLAKKLVGHFGAEVLGVIEKNPADLESVDGIGPKRRERIATAWHEGMQIREIMLFPPQPRGQYRSSGSHPGMTHGNLAIQTVRENPYTLSCAEGLSSAGAFSLSLCRCPQLNNHS